MIPVLLLCAKRGESAGAVCTEEGFLSHTGERGIRESIPEEAVLVLKLFFKVTTNIKTLENTEMKSI